MHAILQGKRLIAFDLDGTLIDSVPDLAVAVRHALDDVGLPVPGEERVRDWVGNGAQVLIERALTWALSVAPGQALQATAYEAFMCHYAAAPNALTQLYPGVRTALHDLYKAGYSLVLITNKPERFIAPILGHFDLLPLFTHCLGGDSLAEKKPSPLPLLYMAQRLDTPPSASVMVGDSRHDIAAGKAAGFTTVALPYGYNHGEPIEHSQPDLIISSLLALTE
ncbi:phosphoglycolate phosphatase [Vreelandella andesensis]|uniref:Phosphoglycolate phosphatase n=1 Tax=Vreelandella andesensis TaxID=447567 RepID=A0A3S0WBB3_9GAMM|nr:phosphoglycolate phosphatase [Halomonas andesensis]RUR33988.1 phosphoglycolate phosphatase [Halomonas andesensis]